MIFLSGGIRIASQHDLAREGEVYAQRGWELKDPTTHNVTITIDEDDIEALAAYLRSKPRDKKLKVWTDRHGVQHQVRTVTLYLKGTEMAGNWVRLRAAIDPAQGQQGPPAAADQQGTISPPRQRAAPPLRRAAPATAAAPQTPTPQPAAPPLAVAPSPPSLAWAGSADPEPPHHADDTDDLPF